MEGQSQILIASANAGVREFFRRLRRFQDYGTLEASSGEECMNLVRKEHPEVILLDPMLPDQAGAGVYHHVKSDPALADKTKVLFLFSPEPSSGQHPPEQFPLDVSPQPSYGDGFDRFFALSLDLLCIAGFDGYFKRLNPAWERLLGYTVDELKRRPILTFVHPDDHDRTSDEMEKLQRGQPVVSFENRVKGKDGLYRSLVWNAVSSPSERFIHAVARDVTEQRQNEDRLRTLSRVVEQSPVSVMVTDVKGNIEYVNPKFREASGFSDEELLGKNPRVMKSGKQSPDVYRELWQTITAGNVWRGALQNLKKNGEVFWEYETITPVRDAAGTTTHYVAIKEDITGRRLAEEQIRSQSALLDVATDAILIRDLDDRVLYWNKGAEKIYGWTSDEALGKTIAQLFAPPREQLEAAMQTLMREGSWHGEMTHQTNNNRSIVAECRWSLVYDDNGRPSRVLGINSDITEKKKLEAQFLRAQRMESIGTLAGGIAHDLNNILGPILLSIDYLQQKDLDPASRRVLSTLETSANRGADLIRQVLMFARGVEGERVVLQPAHLIKDVVKILSETFPRGIAIHADLPKDLWTVSGDPTQLHQVLMNLCVNARDAMPDGGRIEIRAENVELDEHYVRTNLEAGVGPYVVITVADTGIGIPPQVISRIFEPFFTTKESGKGTGIGLSTARAIVKSHGGFVNVYSELSHGTTFKIYLPARTTGREKKTEATQALVPRGNGELILVVDDEVSILEVTKASLEAFGYRVVTAQDGTEALAIYSQLKDDIQVVLTDMMMPYLDGPATIRALRKINPRVRIIASSGLEVNGKLTNISGQVDAFLPKPYTGEKILKTLKEVLSRQDR